MKDLCKFMAKWHHYDTAVPINSRHNDHSDNLKGTAL